MLSKQFYPLATADNNDSSKLPVNAPQQRGGNTTGTGGEGRAEMDVIVMKRTREGWPIGPRAIRISDKCPVCGGPRGEPKWHHFCEDGEWLTCQTWDNPCGHVDLYKDVLKEADQLQEAKL